ncbi:adenylyl-sulfate kinase [Candidatus Bipolaricaulota bacterium]|nr:adenylyl-sulfate kinase [Candidatus Bipolaricaulota bacterium]
MIIDRVASDQLPSRITSPDSATRPDRSLITSAERQTRMKQKGATIWITGLHASGKNELAYALERQLFDLGHTVVVLDGASVRSGLSRELDFDPTDRAEHLRRVAETAKIINDHGILVIVVFISPRRSIRAQLAEIIGRERFLEVYAKASLNWCRQHDATGLFAKAEQGNLRFVPGIDIAYEEPQTPDLTIPMETMSASTAVEQIIKQLREKKFIAFN